ELLQGAGTLMVERSPAEAEIPLDELARTPFPKLVVSGRHSPAFEALCDVLEERLGAERAVLPGAGHSVQRLGEPFNELLAGFVEAAAGASGGSGGCWGRLAGEPARARREGGQSRRPPR